MLVNFHGSAQANSCRGGMPDKERGGAAKVAAAKGGATKGGATKGGAKGVERKPSTYMDKVQVQCPCTLDSDLRH